jgi:hypothetical protein
MKRSLILLTSLSLMNCATKTIPPIAIPVSPLISESALKDLSKVKSGIDGSISKNSKLNDSIKEQSKSVINQKNSIQKTLGLAENIDTKITNNQQVTKVETSKLVDSIEQIRVENLFLEVQNSESTKLIKEQSEILSVTKLGADSTELKLRNKEQEANQLREQNLFLGNNLNAKNIEAEELKIKLTDEKVKGSRSAVYRNWILGLIGSFGVWMIIKNILSIYSPFKLKI